MIYSCPLTQPGGLKNEAIVLEVAQKLFGKGYTLWMDNFCNNPGLAKILKGQKTDCAGTLRLNRKNLPKDFQTKKLGKGEMCV